MSHALPPRDSVVLPPRAERNRSVSTAGKERTYETIDQPRTAPQPPPLPQLTSNMLLSLPQMCYPSLPPYTWGSGTPWVPSYPPIVTLSLKGPHFSYDRTSHFSANTQEYKDLLLGIDRNLDLYQKIKDIRWLFGSSKEQRNFVLSSDTLVVLELDFTSSPSHSLIFDALKVPLTRSVKRPVEPRGRRLLALQIILVDAVTETFVRGRGEEGDQAVARSLVDFHAEHNIIDLRDGGVTVRFKLPCCFLDSRYRTGCYRICIAGRLDNQPVGYHTLPHTFEVVHTEKKIPKDYLHYTQTGDWQIHPPHNHCCSSGDNGRKLHSDRHNIIDGCFEWLLSLTLGLDRIPLRNILSSANHQYVLSSLFPGERRQLKGMIELENEYLEHTLTQGGYDDTLLRREYDIVSHLIELVTPIHWLPVELLELVFSFVPEEQFENLTGACHKWREIALSMLAPLKLTSWTSLDEVKAILDRGNGLLGVTIDPLSDAEDRPISSFETEQYVALVLVASTSVSRWRNLEILSLPDPYQINALFGEQSHIVDTVPMNRLRSLSIPIHHDNSLFLDRLLPSIGATISDQLTNMHICSAQTMSYLAQLHCAKVFTYLTSLKCFLPRTDEVIDILPHFSQLESLDVSGFRFPTYAADVELPLAKTLRQLSMNGVPVGWMSHREFPQLESCTIISPPAPDTIPITSIPGCKELVFEGPRFDPIRRFRISTTCTLTLRSTQWSKSRGDWQLSQLWGAVPNEGILHPMSLHLHLTCGSEQLLHALSFIPELKELVLELDRPTALGRRFFMGFLTPTSRITCPRRRAGISRAPLRVCPLLEVMGLKYRRWFRPGEVNEMPALVALAHSDARDRKIRIWVEKSITDQERVEVGRTQISASNLYSLGLLQSVNGEQPPRQVVKTVIEASMGVLNPMSIKFNDAETMIHFSPAIYACVFQHLRSFSLCTDIDQGVLLKAVAHFEHLKEVHLRRFIPSSPNPHLPLLRTLKKMQLGTTSLSWMEGCTFMKLEDVEIEHIEKDDSDQFQCVRMPVCKSASLPQSLSSELLRGFEMPCLLNLRLHHQGSDQRGRLHCPSTQQFRLHTASFHCVRSGVLQDQPDLEVLEIKGLVYPCGSARGLKTVLDILVDCQSVNSSDLDLNNQGTLRRELHFCPKLKELKLELANEWDQEWEREWEQEWGRVQGTKRQRQHIGRLLSLVQQEAEAEAREREQEQERDERDERDELEEREWLSHLRDCPQELREIQRDAPEQWKGPAWKQGTRERTCARVRKQELKVRLRFENANWEMSGPRLCQKFMKRRRAKGCPLQRLQIAIGSWQMEITN